MNVLNINYRFSGGGAAAVASGLFGMLSASGHTSNMLIGCREATVPGVASIALSWPARLPYHLVNLFGLNYLGIPGQHRLLTHPFLAGADVVHLHNLHGGYFNYRWLANLTILKPVVWTLHDMWPLTGHCSHSFDCGRWRTGCGQCPYPGTYPPIRMDATRLDWRLKSRLYQRVGVVIITPSRWLADLVRESTLRHLPLHVVPNAVDTEVYAPRPSEECRRALGLPPDRFVLLFAAEHVNSPFKRFEFLPKVLELIPADIRRHLLLLVMGADAPRQTVCGDVPIVCLGLVTGEKQKTEIFGAADLLLYPTRADNCPMVVQEALACGCPIVAENVGGVGELVRPNETGLLVPPDDAGVFADCIGRLFIDRALRMKLAERCRAVALSEYSRHSHVERMICVYQEAIERHRRKKWETDIA
jgi:glycosyltransferase involved in cell wall biosynthesis